MFVAVTIGGMKVDDIPQEFQSVNRLFEEFIAKGEFAKLDEVYTKEARILPPGADMVTGLANVQDFWKAAVSALSLKSLTLRTVELDILGDTAIEIGRADLVTEHATPPSVTVKYVVVWKQEVGGWRWDIDIWNPAAS